MKNLFRLIRKFLKLSWFDKILLLEVFFLTGIARAAILIFSFNKIAKITGISKSESDMEIGEENLKIAVKVGWAIHAVSKRTPWESKCLVRAITAQVILHQKKISSTMYLGVAKDENKKLTAHAWVRCGSYILTGADEMKNFVQVAKFATSVGRGKN